MYNNKAGGSNTTTPKPVPYPQLRIPPPISGATDDNEWGKQETRDLIEIRAQIEWNFNTIEISDNLWEMLANRMAEKGYLRTVDQCKFKWRYLVNVYKELEASGIDNVQQCPFFDELHAVFTARADKLQHVQLDSKTLSMEGKNKRKDVLLDHSHVEEEINIDQVGKRNVAPKRKEKRQKITQLEKKTSQSLTNANNNNNNILVLLQEMLSNFLQQQQRIDMELREVTEKRELERVIFEQEWRQTMEKLERERLVMEQAWREREEERRLRDEKREEKRDALLTALLNKLIHDQNP